MGKQTEFPSVDHDESAQGEQPSREGRKRSEGEGQSANL